MENHSALERNLDTYYNIDEPWGHHAKWTKPITEKTNPVWFHLYKVYRVHKFIETENGVVAATGWEGGEWEMTV